MGGSRVLASFLECDPIDAVRGNFYDIAGIRTVISRRSSDLPNAPEREGRRDAYDSEADGASPYWLCSDVSDEQLRNAVEWCDRATAFHLKHLSDLFLPRGVQLRLSLG